MLKNKSKLIALITAFTLGTGSMTSVKTVKADEITMEAVQTVEDSVLEVEDITENNKVIEILNKIFIESCILLIENIEIIIA